MDQQKLRHLVFEKTGVRIDVDDPVFALVALNEAVLAEAVERHIALLHEASARITGLPAPAPADAAAVPASASVPASAPAPVPAHGPAPASAPRPHPALHAAGAAVLGAALVLAGQALWFKPTAPAPAVAAPALSAEQDAALRDVAKLTRAIEKLDRKTRSAIAAEMAKP